MWKKLFLFLSAALCFIMLFVSRPITYKIQSLEVLWNLGHIATYCLWTYLLIKYYTPLNRQSYGYQWIWVIGIALFFGAGVEIIQKQYLGRSADINDIIKNLIGCGIALTFFAPTRKNNRRIVLLSLKLMVLIILIGEFLPLAEAVTDEWIAREQFPVLGSFETPFEINRWEPNISKITIDHHIRSQGKSSLRIDLRSARFSGANLEYFPRDWRGYSSISFAVYNPQNYPLKMVCRINDFDHNLNGYLYNDRFNLRISIKPGWTQIKIPLEEVQDAPVHRCMDMTEIDLFTIFFPKLDRPQIVYLDDLRLN